MAFTQSDYGTIASIFFLGGSLGLALNILVLYNMLKLPNFKCAFGYISLSHSISALGNNMVFAFALAPMTLIDVLLHSSTVGSRAGLLIYMLWQSGMFSHVLMAVNRFVSVYFPRSDHFVMTKRFACIAIGVVWVASAATSLIQLIPGCENFLVLDTFHFTFNNNVCGALLGLYADFMVSITCIVIVVVLDFFTFLKIRKNRVRIDGSEPVVSKENIQFFYQSAVQGLVVFFEIFTYFYVSPNISNIWIRLSLSTCLLMAVNVVDPVIIIYFSDDIQENLKHAISRYEIS
ncbi:hypothetical protein QR680_007195 [Steinernema hermaphroditum]|uniref:G-protein coupled receptors family 1 profile domain-containing protein n=1 Tax=Steinernema hermaphroditum TaxID=289476 RepID=A0AA39I091_9BILA|nr:hypothetical protein QR680_007195 [Steinernema hermaphroditum]